LVFTSTRDCPSTIPSPPNRRNPNDNFDTHSYHTLSTPTTNFPTTTGGRRKKKEPTTPLPPCVQPPCALCEKDGHQTNNFPSLPELWNLIPLNQTTSTLTTVASTATSTPHSSRKGMQTKFAYAICSEYGHYTHHCPTLPRFRQTLAAVHQSFQNEPNPDTSSLPKITDIHYVMTSVNECMRCPCSLCESLDHFTYQCPMIIEYRQHQLTLIQTPVPLTKSMVDLTSSLEILHIICPEPEALSMPPWFLDDLSKDSPPNPPNSPIHFPMKILHPTTTSTPQYFDIWFMSGEPSQSHCIVPLASSSLGDSHTTIVTDITLYDPLYSCQFHCDEDILEELNTPDYPWDALHHRALLFPQKSSMPPNQHPIYAVETKDFIPSGHIDWFNNPILGPDAFEEGIMANISLTIKIDISIKNGVIEEITIGISCTPQEINTYKALF
jgi:hypothetical protein